MELWDRWMELGERVGRSYEKMDGVMGQMDEVKKILMNGVMRQMD